ncbi:MAG: DNA polymerase I [Micrococcaceae bacterium]
MSSKTSEEKEIKRLLVIDGHSLAFRAYYGVPVDNFKTTTGQHTNAVHGFISMLINLIRDKRPTHLAVAFDQSGPTFRTKEYSEYKAGRSATPEEFKGQIELIQKVLDAMNIKHMSLSEYEADDILATWSQYGLEDEAEVLVVSGDRDTFQLVNDDVTVLYPRRGVSDLINLDPKTVEQKYLVPPDKYPVLAALVGEKADNLPGVPGVGPKTAVKWINLYGDIAGIIEHQDEIKGKVGEALRDNIDNVVRNRKLNKLLTDLELETELDDLIFQNISKEDLEEAFNALEFRTLRNRVFKIYDKLALEGSTKEFSGSEVQIVTDAKIIKKFGKQTHALMLWPEEGEAEGIVIADNDNAYAVQFSDIDVAVDKALNEYLLDKNSEKAVYDLKEMLHRLANRGYMLKGVNRDLYLEAYIAHPERREYLLEDLIPQLANIKLNPVIKTEEAGEQLELDIMGDAEAEKDNSIIQNTAMIAQGTLLALEQMTKEVDYEKRQDLLVNIEIPMSYVLFVMEHRGIAVDDDLLGNLEAEVTKRAKAAEEQAFSLISEPVNLSSPKQLQKVLFEELNLPKTRKIRSGYSTDIESLRSLLEQTGHEFLVNLMAYRDSTKLSQIVAGLRKTIADDGRIHTTFEQTIASTGRLSSINPNLQNIPIRSETGREIRKSFICGKDYDNLVSADYSQIEMRIMAHLSKSIGLIDAFKAGEDLHNYVGSQIFDVHPFDVTPDMRAKVKAMSYGLAYGLSSFGLSKQLSISVDEARKMMNDYFNRFGEVREYLREVVAQAKKDGYTETIMGRRRYLPDLNSDNYQMRQMAERAALNAPIQGSAADIIKVAMIRIERKLQEGNYKSQMLLQIHDELILEVIASEQEEVVELVKTEMENAIKLSVPLDVNIGIGKNWHDAAH